MTIGIMGAYGASYLSQMLPSLLSRLTGTASTASTSSSTSTSFTTGSTGATTASGSGTSLTGNPKAQLSDQILGLLTMLQADPSQNGALGATNTSTTTPASSSSPLSSLVSAIDTDGDGSVSQSEMQSYIQSLGGTQSQADALFQGLNQNGSGNLTTAQLQSDLQSAAAGHHAHGHHHGHRVAADNGTSQQASDSDNDAGSLQPDGSVNGQGSTTSRPSSVLSAYQNSQTAGNPVLSLLDGIASTAKAATQTMPPVMVSA